MDLMPLFTRIGFRKKYIMKRLWMYIPILLSIWSCSNEPMELGSNLVESSSRTILIDTCTVALTTVKIDSLATSGKNILYVGQFNDEFRGIVSTTSYVSFLKPTYSEHRRNSTTPLRFDSLVFEMDYASYFYGDTINPQQFDLHFLNKGLELPLSGSFYNTSSVEYNNQALLNVTFTPHPNRGESLSVRLPEYLGEDLLSKMANGDDVLTTNEKFLLYFPGLAFVPKDSNSAVFGFHVADTSVVIKLYYHFVEEVKKEYSVTISPNTSSNFFSVQHDRSATPLKNIENGYAGMSSSRSENMAYLFGSVGYYTRIEFPYLSDLLKIGNAGDIISAELLLDPVSKSYNDQFPLPDQLYLYIADDTNASVDAITNSYGTGLQTGNLVKDELFNKNTHYSFSITSFLKEQLPAMGINKKKLHLTLTDSEMNQTFSSILLGDHQHPNQRIKVIVKYSLYE
jgi:hypothetical protein